MSLAPRVYQKNSVSNRRFTFYMSSVSKVQTILTVLNWVFDYVLQVSFPRDVVGMMHKYC